MDVKKLIEELQTYIEELQNDCEILEKYNVDKSYDLAEIINNLLTIISRNL